MIDGEEGEEEAGGRRKMQYRNGLGDRECQDRCGGCCKPGFRVKRSQNCF